MFQAKLADSVFRAWVARDYSQLAVTLEILAGSIGDARSVRMIAMIKEECSFDFEAYAMLYRRALVMPPSRHLRFPGMRRMPWSEIRARAEREFVKPLNEVAIALLSKLSEEVSLQVTQMIDQINRTEGINPVFEESGVIDDISGEPREVKG